MADPAVKTINAPNNNNIIMIGNNQYFLRTLKNAHKSLNTSINMNFITLIGMFNIL